MIHSYQLVWLDYFPNERHFELYRNNEAISRYNGRFFIYFVYFHDIKNQISVKIYSQSESTKTLVHACLFENCTTNGNAISGGCLHFLEYGLIIINKVNCRRNSANNAPYSGQSITIHSEISCISMLSISNCYGTGDFSPVLEINSDAIISSLNETNNKCKDVTAFRLFTNSSTKYSLFSSNIASRYRILFWGIGKHTFIENMVIDNNATSQGISLLEEESTLTLTRCSFVNNKGKILFYVHSYQNGISQMTIENCSLIGNEIDITYYTDPGMVLNIENIGETSFQVFLPFLSPFDTLPPYQNYEISCNRITCGNYFLIYLAEVIIIA